MQSAILETERRREIQERYNKEHGIVPKTIVKDVREILEISRKDKGEGDGKQMSRIEREQLIKRLSAEMRKAAELLQFEQAAYLRDRIARLRGG